MIDTNEATTNFLWAASKLLRSISCGANSPENKNIDTITSTLRFRKFNVLDGRKNKHYLCLKCNNPWSEGRFSLRVRSAKVTKRHKKLINSLSENVKSHYSRRQLESLKLKQDNVMVFHCHICQSIVKCFITKQKVEILPTTTVTKVDSTKKTGTKKKKKRKKDNLAGLKIENIVNKKKNLTSGFKSKE
ncbi:uncharacterized protein [Rhodnius prolixus]|uniref:Protein panstrongylus lignarius n=1 Tax=Rhodnius prolixus TaxID=13249 RepID=A0A4P6DGP1_RHOPR